jgi:hypothetical protein
MKFKASLHLSLVKAAREISGRSQDLSAIAFNQTQV